MWKQTDCGTGGTTTDATIQNVNTESNLAAWENQITISANQITWCSDEGLKSASITTLSQTGATTKPISQPTVNPTPLTRPTPIPTTNPTPTPGAIKAPTSAIIPTTNF